MDGASITIPTKTINSASGRGGSDAGDEGQVVMSKTTSTSSNGSLPVWALLACIKTENPPQSALIPQGITFFISAANCPNGSYDVPGSEGRFLVGLPAGGTDGAAFGGQPYAPITPAVKNLPTHSHKFSGSVQISEKFDTVYSGKDFYVADYGTDLPFKGVSGDTSDFLPFVVVSHCVHP
jgi:hypothetical protein